MVTGVFRGESTEHAVEGGVASTRLHPSSSCRELPAHLPVLVAELYVLNYTRLPYIGHFSVTTPGYSSYTLPPPQDRGWSGGYFGVSCPFQGQNYCL